MSFSLLSEGGGGSGAALDGGGGTLEESGGGGTLDGSGGGETLESYGISEGGGTGGTLDGGGGIDIEITLEAPPAAIFAFDLAAAMATLLCSIDVMRSKYAVILIIHSQRFPTLLDFFLNRSGVN